jgi:hypothetical protein
MRALRLQSLQFLPRAVYSVSSVGASKVEWRLWPDDRPLGGASQLSLHGRQPTHSFLA